MVNFVDDFQVAGQQLAKQVNGPALQRLGHEGVVRVAKDPLGNLPGGFPLKLVDVEQQTHQLSHPNGRVGIVELNSGKFSQVIQAPVVAQVQADDVLEGTGHKEVLLLQA